MINLADVSQLIYQRIWELSKILDEKDFFSRVEELCYLQRTLINHEEKLRIQEKQKLTNEFWD